MRADRRCREGGFTLIEVMIIIVIVGVLAGVAGQNYRRFVEQSKVSEVPVNMKQIVHGEMIYFTETHLDHNQKSLPKQYRALPATPTADPCANGQIRYPVDTSVWQKNGWSDIHFAIHQSHFYQYKVDASGTGTSATFTVTARGNLDCDNVFSTFRTYVETDQNGQPSVQGMVILKELE